MKLSILYGKKNLLAIRLRASEKSGQSSPRFFEFWEIAECLFMKPLSTDDPMSLPFMPPHFSFCSETEKILTLTLSEFEILNDEP